MDRDWQGSIHVDAPVEEVYRYLADFPKHCEWAQTLERMEETKPGDSTGIGRTYRTTERQAFQSDRAPREELNKGFKGTTMCEVRDLVPNQRIAWHSYALPKMGISADLAFELTPKAGGTTVKQQITMHQPAAPMWLFRKFVFKMSAEEMETRALAQWQASLANIKAILEEKKEGASPPV
ncbi:MAG: SRPBCC family protein [Thermomicrobiales bacterium]